MSMNIRAPKGTKVVYKNMGNGCKHDRNTASLHLIPGRVYTVHYTNIHAWQTDVYLEEIPGVSFNSVLFEEIDNPTVCYCDLPLGFWYITVGDKYMWRDGTIHSNTGANTANGWLCGCFHSAADASIVRDKYAALLNFSSDHQRQIRNPPMQDEPAKVDQETESFTITVNPRRPIYTVTSNVHGVVATWTTNRQLDAVGLLVGALSRAIQKDGKELNDQRRNS